MKKMIQRVGLTMIVLLMIQSTILLTSTQASEQTYVVQSGDTLYRISQQYGVPVHVIRDKNNIKNNLIYPGNRLIIPNAITATEKDLLARLVRAEAVGEPYAGKVAVAVVILNRADSSLFPNTVSQVINQPGQFTPVANGMINKPADPESIRAVNEALMLRGTGSGSLYFYNPKKTNNQWLRSKQVTIIIGNHTFAK